MAQKTPGPSNDTECECAAKAAADDACHKSGNVGGIQNIHRSEALTKVTDETAAHEARKRIANESEIELFGSPTGERPAYHAAEKLKKKRKIVHCNLRGRLPSPRPLLTATRFHSRIK